MWRTAPAVLATVCIVLSCALGSPVPVLQAQDDVPLLTDQPLEVPAFIGEPMSDSISDEAFFDWYTVELTSGDDIFVRMQASPELAPLLGVLTQGRDLVARSDAEGDASPGDSISLRYTAAEAGTYTVVAARVGLNEGTTTGEYQLTIDRVQAPPPRERTRAPITFRCENTDEPIDATTVLMLRIDEETLPVSDEQPFAELIRITVLATDDFEPVIQAEASVQEAPLQCNDRFAPEDGTTVQGWLPIVAPGDGPSTEAMSWPAESQYGAQLTLRNSSPVDIFGRIDLIIGSRDGGGGDFVVIVEGLRLNYHEDVDEIGLFKAVATRTGDMQVAMVARSGTRMDGVMTLTAASGDVLSCDDVGSDDCAAVPSVVGDRIRMPDGAEWVATRLDPLLLWDDHTVQPAILTLQSRGQQSAGEYVLIVLGTLPGASDE